MLNFLKFTKGSNKKDNINIKYNIDNCVLSGIINIELEDNFLTDKIYLLLKNNTTIKFYKKHYSFKLDNNNNNTKDNFNYKSYYSFETDSEEDRPIELINTYNNEYAYMKYKNNNDIIYCFIVYKPIGNQIIKGKYNIPFKIKLNNIFLNSFKYKNYLKDFGYPNIATNTNEIICLLYNKNTNVALFSRNKFILNSNKINDNLFNKTFNIQLYDFFCLNKKKYNYSIKINKLNFELKDDIIFNIVFSDEKFKANIKYFNIQLKRKIELNYKNAIKEKLKDILFENIIYSFDSQIKIPLNIKKYIYSCNTPEITCKYYMNIFPVFNTFKCSNIYKNKININIISNSSVNINTDNITQDIKSDLLYITDNNLIKYNIFF